MKHAQHPVLGGLFRMAAAPALQLARWQASHDTITALGGRLPSLGVVAEDPWAALLQVPFGDGDGALRAALDRLTASTAVPAADDAERGPQPMAAVAARPAAQRAARGTDPHARERGASVAPAGVGVWPAVATVPVSSAATGITPHAAAAAWQRRAERAGAAAALVTPVRAEPAAGVQGAAWPAAGAAVHPALPPAAPVSSASPVGGSLPVERAGTPVELRLRAALDRIERRVAGNTAQGAPLPSAATFVMGARPAALPPSWPGEPPAAVPSPSMPAWSAPRTASAAPAAAEAPRRPASGLGGLRGLAARAAAAASSPSLLPAGSPGAEPARSAAMQHLPDDDHLAEQLARLLEREARRAGIDVSDVSP
jgi:hypothetical protein